MAKDLNRKLSKGDKQVANKQTKSERSGKCKSKPQ